MIEPFLARLQQVGLELTDEDIADSLWLAMQMGSPVPPSPPPESPQQEQSRQQPEQLPLPETIPEGSSALEEEEIPPELDAVLPSDSEENQKSDTDPLPFRAPATTALQDALALGRALRPLMGKVPSKSRKVLDEDATVSQIAEQDIWIPVLKPEQERWLDLELIVEESRSSFIWQDAVDEFQHLLKCQGAFRTVRVWRLTASEHGEPLLFPFEHTRKTYLRPRGYRELLHASQRGLMLLVSDCTSTLWTQARLHPWLHYWSHHQPTALMQLMPQRLWGSSELGLGSRVQLKALAPGTANSKLVLESLEMWERENLNWNKTLVLPVVTLEAQSLKQWARMVSGARSAEVPGILFDLDFVERQVIPALPEQITAIEVEPEELVDRFLAAASPTAQQLAGMMAAAPVSLPVVHLIQRKLLPESTPVHVAEVFLSGMVKRTSGNCYEFVRNIRQLLNLAMPWSKTSEVLDAVSEYVAEKLGKSIKSFEALLLEHQEWSETEQEEALPFAQLTLEVLRNLGGEFALFADDVEQHYEWNSRRKTVSTTAPEIPNAPSVQEEFPGIPPLEEFSFEVPTVSFEEEEAFPPVETQSVEVINLLWEEEEGFPPETDSTVLGENDFPTIETQSVEVTTITLEFLPEIDSPVLEENYKQFSFEVVTVNRQGEIIQRETKQAQYFQEKLSNDVDLDMVAIPGGTFMMGSPEGEGYDSERPQHQVSVQPFFMGKYPVTQAQWRVVANLPKVNRDLEPDPSFFKGDNRPVEKVSWYDVVEFCDRFSKYTGKTYRLPSEAEWEYACRAGTITPFHFGETISTDLANYRGTDNEKFGRQGSYGHGSRGKYRQETTPVDYFRVANTYGLCDMHGNIYEWCLDYWHYNYENSPTDGSAWIQESDNRGENRLLEKDNLHDDDIEFCHRYLVRGGSWFTLPRHCRSANRYGSDGDVIEAIGFRVVYDHFIKNASEASNL